MEELIATFPGVELTGRSIDPAYIDVSFADAGPPPAMQKFLVANPVTSKRNCGVFALGGLAVAVVGGRLEQPVDA